MKLFIITFFNFAFFFQAQKSFEAWGGKKDEVLKNKRKEIKKKEQTLKEEEDEKLQKAKDAQKYFESWKQQKDEENKVSEKKRKISVPFDAKVDFLTTRSLIHIDFPYTSSLSSFG